MKTRAPYYFKLHKKIQMGKLSFLDPKFVIWGDIRKRIHGLPAFLDPPVQLLHRQYSSPKYYETALHDLEIEAFRVCDELVEFDKTKQLMYELHALNLKKLNLGYQLICWFRGLGNIK